MLKAWEKRSYREQPEYDPQNYCSGCEGYFYKYQLEEHGDGLYCSHCLENILEEEEANESNKK